MAFRGPFSFHPVEDPQGAIAHRSLRRAYWKVFLNTLPRQLFRDSYTRHWASSRQENSLERWSKRACPHFSGAMFPGNLTKSRAFPFEQMFDPVRVSAQRQSPPQVPLLVRGSRGSQKSLQARPLPTAIFWPLTLSTSNAQRRFLDPPKVPR